MFTMSQVGKVLIMIGAGLVVFGVLVSAGTGFGRLPGDVVIQRKDYVVYVPVLSSIIVSIVLSLVYWAVTRYFGE
ncbi:MAG TPA: DUF2905 domain-containing protein [Candidatus Binatia bacterium]|jgi:hypothetical protein|nr:DUF2905 domain-containing protein [Candidatus Binatia bacterium]